MAYSDKWKDTVDKVSETIDNAVGTNDFSNLSRKVTDLLDKARTSTIHALGGTDAEETSASSGRVHESSDKADSADEDESEEFRRQEARRREKEHKLLVKQCFSPPLSTKEQKTKMYSGIALTVFVGLFSIVMPPLWIVFFILLIVIHRQKKRIRYNNRYNTYRRRLMKHFYADVPALAQSVQQSRQETIRDLKNMMKDGLFREGHFDRQETCFIASDDAYQQYLITQRHYAEDKIRRAEEQTEAELNQEEQTNFYDEGAPTQQAYTRNGYDKPDERRGPQKDKPAGAAGDEAENDADLPSDVRKMLREGRDYVNFLQEVNDEIEDETVSEKLDRMKTIVSRIFVELRQRPEKVEKLHPFESYYMPTTKKLLTSYVSLNEQPVKSPKIVKSMKEIEDSLDPINDAFETLLDDLFGDVELDVASEIAVMKSMMKQDGLMPDEFEKNKQQ